jgi:hypothetical protein
MATIHNTDLTKELKEGGKLQQLRDVIPSQLADKVVPVMEVNPKLLRITNTTATATVNATGAGTVYTTPADKDFFLTNVHLHVIKNVVCDAATGVYVNFTVVQDGATKSLIALSGITLTAQEDIVTLNLSQPMKIDRNSLIRWTGTYAAGVMVRSANVIGYVVENINA